MCRIWEVYNKEQNYVSISTIQKTLDEIRNWLGPIKITFCGPGETFTNPDSFLAMEYAAKIGLEVVFTSNGTLINDALAKKIVNAGILHANISIDGIHAHDYLRGNGVYVKAIRGIENLNKYRKQLNKKMTIMINCLVTEKNLDELKELEIWTKKNDIKIRFNSLNANTRDDLSNELWIKDFNKLDNILDQLKIDHSNFNHILNCKSDFETMKSYYRNPLNESNTKRNGTCLGAVETLYIRHTGDVSTCAEPLGNILNNSLTEIWYSENTKRKLRKLRYCPKRCFAKCRDKGSLLDRANVFLRALRN
jgi:MoaA/NifB/PqqE/SkfB family radical SAM enzyme